jgi:hypothetical protein
MAWLKQHSEAGRVLVTARVEADGSDFTVYLAVPGGRAGAEHPIQEGHAYRTRDVAFAAADVLVRHRHGGHVCTPACAGWVQDSAGPKAGGTATLPS